MYAHNEFYMLNVKLLAFHIHWSKESQCSRIAMHFLQFYIFISFWSTSSFRIVKVHWKRKRTPLLRVFLLLSFRLFHSILFFPKITCAVSNRFESNHEPYTIHVYEFHFFVHNFVLCVDCNIEKCRNWWAILHDWNRRWTRSWKAKSNIIWEWSILFVPWHSICEATNQRSSIQGKLRKTKRHLYKLEINYENCITESIE